MRIHAMYQNLVIWGVAIPNRPALFLHMSTLTLYYPALTGIEETGYSLSRHNDLGVLT
jgi:hypothetical protein